MLMINIRFTLHQSLKLLPGCMYEVQNTSINININISIGMCICLDLRQHSHLRQEQLSLFPNLNQVGQGQRS